MIPVNATIISRILKIESRGGFNFLVKKRTWPKGKQTLDLAPVLIPVKDNFAARGVIDPLIIDEEFWSQPLTEEETVLLGGGI